MCLRLPRRPHGFTSRHRADDVAENVIRRLLSYGIGRTLTVRDRFAVEELLRQSKNNGYKLQDMIVSICQSPTFKNQ